MRIKKKLAALVLVAATLATATAGAEQAKAEEYRKMFASGNFYVKYGVGKISKGNELYTPGINQLEFDKISATKEKYKAGRIFMVVAGKDGKRMKGIYGNEGFVTGLNRYDTIQLNKKKTAPDVLYADGKYYRTTFQMNKKKILFLGTQTYILQKAIILPEEKMGSSSLDPMEGWDHIRKDLALPDELAFLWWDDPYYDRPQDAERPSFVKSGKATVNNKTYDYDEYVVVDVRVASGVALSQKVWRALYAGGALVYVQQFHVADGAEELTGMIDVREIALAASDELFKLPKGMEIYAADEGKMYDLTEAGLLLEKVGEDNRQKKANAGEDEK